MSTNESVSSISNKIDQIASSTADMSDGIVRAADALDSVRRAVALHNDGSDLALLVSDQIAQVANALVDIVSSLSTVLSLLYDMKTTISEGGNDDQSKH